MSAPNDDDAWRGTCPSCGQCYHQPTVKALLATYANLTALLIATGETEQSAPKAYAALAAAVVAFKHIDNPHEQPHHAL